MRSTTAVLLLCFIHQITQIQSYAYQNSDFQSEIIEDEEAKEEEEVLWKWGEIVVKSPLGKRDKRQATEDEEYSQMKREISLSCGHQRVEIKLEAIKSPQMTVKVREGDEYLNLEDEGLEEEEDDREPCHWKGRVEGGGTATLSTCMHPEGYTGMVMTPDGVWLIQPRPNNDIFNDLLTSARDRTRRRSTRRKSNSRGIPHLMLPPDDSASQLRRYSHYSDVARVPLEELEAAARLAAQEAKEREDEVSATELSEEEEEIVVPLSSQENRRNGDWNDVQLLTRRSRSQQSSTSGKKWVEMALFTDENMYKRMNDKFPNETVSKLKDYATTLINTMDILYGDKSLGASLGFRLVHLEVMKKSPSSLDPNGGKAKAYLSSFCEYAGEQNSKGGKWDHALLLTGIDLHEQGLKSTAGLAWAGTMCYRYYSCSIAEGTSFGSAFIVTHEIGHSLGMEHDGVGVSETCDKNKYIMSPTTGPGKINWSNCSGKNLNDFMEYGTSELRAKKYTAGTALTTPTCLTQLVSKSSTSTSSAKLPGETYDAYFQCALGLGNKFKPFFQRNKSPFNNICWVLYCGNGTHAVSTHPALEGTKCDKDKYCRAGECIVKPKKSKSTKPS